MTARTRLFVLILAVVVATPASQSRLRAECVTPPPPCQALAAADLVFYGEVVSTSSGRFDDPRTIGLNFKVLQAFKNVKGAQFSGTFLTGSAEDPFFGIQLEGLRTIVYARKLQGLWTTTCSRTVLYDPAGGAVGEAARRAVEHELEQLAACPRPTPATR